MKAEEYITQWCDETYKGGKELGDWTTKEVMKFANDFANEKFRLLSVSGSLPEISAIEHRKLMKQLYPNDNSGKFRRK